MIKLNVVTPSGQNHIKDVAKVEIKAVEGNLTILENHIPFISLINNGYVKYEKEIINIEDGVVHFSDNNLYVTYFS